MSEILFQGSRFRIQGDLPAIGSHAPDLMLVNTKLVNVTLAEFLGQRKILNIFPSIDTPVCARSVQMFDKLAVDRDDVTMLMISSDLPFAHTRFSEQHNLLNVVALSSMRHAGFGENYGVQIVEGPLEGLFARAVVVLDENDTVVYHEQIDDISTEPDYAAAFKALGIDIDSDSLDL